MSTDVGEVNEPLSLIVIPSAAEAGAGSTDDASQPATSFQSQPASNTASDAPSTISPSSSPKNTADLQDSAPVSTQDEPPPTLVQIELVKVEDQSHENNVQHLNLDGLQEGGTSAGDIASGSGEEQREWSENEHEMKRVKVCP